MAEQSYDEILWAILEESAELDTLTKEKEELQWDLVQMWNEFNDEFEKKKCELQAIKEQKAQMKGDIKRLRSTRSQLIQVYIQLRGGKSNMVIFFWSFSISLIWMFFFMSFFFIYAEPGTYKR